MRVVVDTAAEARLALEGGADGVLLRVDAAKGRLARSMWRDVRAALPNTHSLGVAMSPEMLRGMALSGQDVAGIDEIWMSGDGAAGSASLPGLESVAKVAMLSPDAEVDAKTLQRFAGVCLGSLSEPRRLLVVTTVATLQRGVTLGRDRGLRIAIGGHLEAPDVPRLLALSPDEIVLDAVVRTDAALDPDRLRLLRDLIPRDAPTLSGATRSADHDRIFVHDWTIPMHIGAYSHEREPQRVRFSVEADILRHAGRPSDLRHVVSYDLITDAIGRHTVAHVDLVETLAEDIAQTILLHPRVARVEITVEKLDLGPGALGCRIVRSRGDRF